LQDNIFHARKSTAVALVGLFIAVTGDMTYASESSCLTAERVLDNLSTTVLVFDAQFRLIFINQAGEVMLAHSARHACGRLIHELVVNAEALVEQLASAFTTQQVISKRGCQLQLPDAPDLRVNCTFTPVIENGEVTTVQVELRQIDHQLRVEQEELLITQQEATRALVRGLAHEIKNPLGGLRGAAQLLEREITDDALKEYTHIIIGEADRLQGLMNRMLGPNNLPEMRAVNIHEVLERVRNLVQAEAGDSLQILQDYDPSLPNLYADPDLLTQAILNIVRNANQALGGRGEILLRTRIQRNSNIGTRKHRLIARIEIIDNGPGIEEGLRRKIFYPMVTNRSDGTGLGLSIAQALVSRHHGLIECASQPGETTFTILLPLEDINAAQ
jgi:two-component system nitrogen regulation sensor histidine kinase GlnL